MKKPEDFTYLREYMGDRIKDYKKEVRPDGSVVYIYGELNVKRLVRIVWEKMLMNKI